MNMRSLWRATWRHYLFAVLCIGGATGLRLLLGPLFGSDPGFTPYYFAVLLVAWFGGLAPALAAALLSTLSVDLLFLHPVGSLLVGSAQVAGRLALFVLSLLGIALLGGKMHFERARAAERAEALEQQQRFLKGITDAIPGMICYWGTDLRARFANAAYFDWFGKHPEQVIGMHMRELLGDGVFRVSEPRARSALRGVAQSFETTLVRVDGSARQILVSYVPDFTRGRVQGIFVMVTDVSTLKSVEARLDELNGELQLRAEAAETANRDLAQAYSELDGFAYAISHDLRAPLRAMSGFTQILMESHALRLDEDARLCLVRIAEAARKMDQLVTGLLVLANPLRGELQQDQVDVSAVAERLLGELAHADPGRRVRCEITPGLTAVGDARMIESVMENLLSNAWKYTAREPMPRIRVYRGEAAGLRGICVQDNGAGFDDTQSVRLFKPFQRLHRAEEFPGLGIGLATAMRIVRRHGGDMRARSVPGQGATFCFWLPDHPVALAATAGPARPLDTEAGQRHA